MAGGLETQVQVPFSDEDSISGLDTFVLEQSSRKADPGKSYVRVHPSSAGITFFSTSGSFHRSQGSLTKNVESYESFNDSNEVTLRYPRPTNLQVELIGKFLTSTGQAATPTFNYDPVRRAIYSSVKGYGVVKVTYNAAYDLFLATFTKSSSGPRLINPNQVVIMVRDGVSFYAGYGTPDDDDDPDLTGYRPMTVVGQKGTEKHTISPSPTTDSELSKQYGLSAINSRLPQLKLEMDPNYPPKLSRGPSAQRVKATTVIRLYPNVQASLSVTTGSLSDTQESATLQVTDPVAFNGSASASLAYQPSSSVGVLIISGSFFDKWGRQFTPRVKVPGDEFNAVQWLTSTSYGSPVVRTVGEDEIVVCDSFNNSIPCYGVLEVSYSVSFRRVEYTYHFDTDRKEFLSAFVAAKFGEQFASLQIQPPSMRGVY